MQKQEFHPHPKDRPLRPDARESIARDRALVAGLIADDRHAWNALRRDIVAPFFHGNMCGVATHCKDAGVSFEEVWSELSIALVRADCAPLRAFRFDSALSTWMGWRLRYAVKTAIKKYALPKCVSVSDDAVAAALNSRIARIPPSGMPAAIELVNGCLAKLWEISPVYVFVLVLRNLVGLSAKEVGAILGKTPANVDQLNHRAQERIRRIRDEQSP